ncbi:MAG TPA: TOMM precursor leader peptide-binding protein [Allosphingosinicella sp.]|nr:TOMM precursor leader peptide-binding protein [Allosphingosinicella sp.]
MSAAAASRQIRLQGLEERFAALIVAALQSEGGSVRTIVGGRARKGELLIAGSGAADIDGQLAAQDEAARAGAGLLRVACATDHLWLGPYVERQEEGCVRCFHLWTMNDWSRAAAKAATDHASATSCWPEPFRIAAAEAVAVEALAPPRRGSARFLSTDFRDWSRHAFFRHPECERCPPLPDDEAEAARAALDEEGAAAGGSFRALSLDALDRIVQVGVDGRCGLVRTVTHKTTSTLFPMAFATLYPSVRPTDIEIGVGRTGSRRADAVVAVLEGIERFAGLRPRARRTTVRGRYSELEKVAVDPRNFILHHPDQFDEPGFRFQPYSPDNVYHWVWAYSFRLAAPVLIPEQLAYYALPAEDPLSSSRFVYETSNGCALGGTMAEAVLHGLFEVIERDAFLASWYARRPVARVDMSGVDDPLVRALLARCRAHEMHVEVLDIRAGLPTPAFAVSIVNRTWEDHAALALAAGAHLDPVRALQGALVEGVSAFADRDAAKAAKLPERGRELLAHPDRVQSMVDHSDQCWPIEAIGTRDFIRSDAPDLDWRACFGAPGNGPVSVPDELAGLVGAVLEVARDVLVLDQSFEPFRASGLRCVKVLAPGLLPMTFGNQHRRISDERLRALAPETPIDRRALGLLPHPFP